jgi:hypothetical protein
MTTDNRGPVPPEPPLAFDSHGHEYTVEHDKVLTALAAAQDRQRAQGWPHGDGVTLDEIASGCDLPRDRVDELLHDLNDAFSLITRPAQEPGTWPRYRVKARL